ncbi:MULTISPECIES: efflux RND transporter periplasmic adaptor subunit [unclassified Cyanobium]|uniref:efflux RND transporter periplasmic adaptor subunit n=1 Tax=unclassified Cyanobium TaxID=2627006 RepID=UPI0020CC6255|nr:MULTISPECIES: efflux RND transporter periplasmic adaptor subunit [unclassified Cyanobium]
MAAKRRPIPAITPLPPAPAPTRSPSPPAAPVGAKRRVRRRVWIGLVVGLALLASAGLWQRQRLQTGRDLAPFTVVAREGSLPGVITASGELDAVQRVNVSPKRQGILVELLVDEGDTVRKGQPLALMDDGDLLDRLTELQANVLSAQAEQRRSDSELRRNEPLFRQGAISLNDMNRFRADAEVRRLATSAAQQRLEQRQVEKSELTVRAPFDGVISQRYAEPGAFVTPTTTASATAGATSSSIVELSEGLEVVAKVPESDIGRLKVGLPASVRVDAFPDRRFDARVRQIAPRAVKTNNVTSFEVKLQLVDPAPELRIGMTADIDFQTGTLQARTVVPTVAIVTEDGRPGVLLVGKGQEPTFQPVELGSSSGKDTQILTGLESGTRVFIDLPPWAKKRP